MYKMKKEQKPKAIQDKGKERAKVESYVLLKECALLERAQERKDSKLQF